MFFQRLSLHLPDIPYPKHPSYSDTFFCLRYGPVSEVWLDGNKGPDSKDMNYLFETWFAAIHQMQPNANIFSDAGVTFS